MSKCHRAPEPAAAPASEVVLLPRVSSKEEPTIVGGKLAETSRDGWCLLLAGRRGAYAGAAGEERRQGSAVDRKVVGLREEKGMGVG